MKNIYRAETQSDLLTHKQLVAIRNSANARRIDPVVESLEMLGCEPNELNRRGASVLITWLNRQPVRRVA